MRGAAVLYGARRAAAFVEGTQLEPHHLQICRRSDPPSPDGDEELGRLNLACVNLQRLERAAIKQTLAHTAGNRMFAAGALGMALSTLYEKVKKYNL